MKTNLSSFYGEYALEDTVDKTIKDVFDKYKYLIVFNYKALNKKINDIKYSLIEKIRTNI